MQNLHIEPTPTTPLINFNADSGNLEINGYLIPEDPNSFIRPIHEWLSEYLMLLPKQIKLVIRLICPHGRSANYLIIKMIKQLEAVAKQGSNVLICWMYDDEDELELGEDFDDLTKLAFEFIEVN